MGLRNDNQIESTNPSIHQFIIYGPPCPPIPARPRPLIEVRDGILLGRMMHSVRQVRWTRRWREEKTTTMSGSCLCSPQQAARPRKEKRKRRAGDLVAVMQIHQCEWREIEKVHCACLLIHWLHRFLDIAIHYSLPLPSRPSCKSNMKT